MRCASCDAPSDPGGARCARCNAALCAAHRPAAGERCAACELEWQDEAPTRRSLQRLFVPSACVLAGGTTLLALLPVLVALPFAIAGPVVAALATTTGLSSGVATYRLVERAARAQFLREHARGLPVARVVRARRALPAPR